MNSHNPPRSQRPNKLVFTLPTPLKVFIADVRLPITGWKAAVAGSRETSVAKVAVGLGPPDDTSSRVGITQLTTTFFRRQLTVSGQVSPSHAGQRTVDQGGHLEVHPLPNRSEHCRYRSTRESSCL